VCVCAVALLVAVVCVLAGAWNWLTDPETPKVPVHCRCVTLIIGTLNYTIF